MSARNRRGATPYAPDVALQFYATPPAAVRVILPRLRNPRELPPRCIVDAGCGEGVCGAACAAYWPTAKIIGVEIHRGRALKAAVRHPEMHVICGDWLSLKASRIKQVDQVDLVIMNAPFARNLQFVQRGLELVQASGGQVAALVRVGWLEGRRGSERATFLESHKPDLFVLGWRPRFGRGRGTDATTYAWCVWGPGRGGRWDRLERLIEPEEPPVSAVRPTKYRAA